MFTNLVEFDSVFGHRRDVAGCAGTLARFDAWLGGFLDHVRPGDLVLVTADQGTDPMHPGTDHTREEVPPLMLHGGRTGALGCRDGFVDVAAGLARHFGLAPGSPGAPLQDGP